MRLAVAAELSLGRGLILGGSVQQRAPTRLTVARLDLGFRPTAVAAEERSPRCIGARLDLEVLCSRLEAEGFSRHFWPERLELLAEMPRTPTGKIQKFVLREMAKRLVADAPQPAAVRRVPDPA